MNTFLIVLVAIAGAVLLLRRLSDERIGCNSCLRTVRKPQTTVLSDGRLVCKECLKQTATTIAERVLAKHEAIRDLAFRITQAALHGSEVLKPSIHATGEKDQTLCWFAMVSEFLYFFMHLANRFAYQEFGHERRTKIQDELYPLIIRPTIESIFGHWPAKLKDGLEAEFIGNLGRAELEYAACKQLLDRNNPLAQDALFSKFAGNVCTAIGVEKTDTAAYAETFMKALELATGAFSRLELRDRVRAAWAS